MCLWFPNSDVRVFFHSEEQLQSQFQNILVQVPEEVAEQVLEEVPRQVLPQQYADMVSLSYAIMLAWCHLMCCHADIPKSGHAVVLACWQWGPEQVPWFLLVVLSFLHMPTYFHVGMLTWHIETVHTLSKTALVGEFAMVPLPHGQIHAKRFFLGLFALATDSTLQLKQFNFSGITRRLGHFSVVAVAVTQTGCCGEFPIHWHRI